MRRSAIVLAALVAWGCGPIDQSGSGSGAGGTSDGGGADGGVAGGGGAPDGGIASGGGGGAPLDCGGVLPADLGSAPAVTTPHGGGDVCWNATADLAGNVAAESHPASMGDAWAGNWQVWSGSGEARGTIPGVGAGLVGQREGFQGAQGDSLVTWSASGEALHRSPLAARCAHDAFAAVTGGTLVIERCGNKLKAYRFDAQGNAVASRDVGEGSAAAGTVDALDRTLIAVAQGGGYGARWYGANLEPASDAFALPGRGSSQPIVRPLIGGGAAIQIDGAWSATSRSGAGAADAAPEWLSSRPKFDLEIIRQGRAYALIPRAGASPHDTLELFSGAGERCGAVKFPAEGLSVGRDGTVIGSSGEGGGCTHAIWSGLLR